MVHPRAYSDREKRTDILFVPLVDSDGQKDVMQDGLLLRSAVVAVSLVLTGCASEPTGVPETVVLPSPQVVLQ